jgi:hypothetical protein
MMKQFALVLNGLVAEIFPEFILVGDGDDAVNVHISERYHPDLVASLIEVPEGQTAVLNGTYSAGTFGPVPPPPAPPPMTAAEAIAMKAARILYASEHIAPLQDMVDLDDASPAEEAELLAWKRYRIALTRITSTSPGWPTNITWPEVPQHEAR